MRSHKVSLYGVIYSKSSFLELLSLIHISAFKMQYLYGKVDTKMNEVFEMVAEVLEAVSYTHLPRWINYFCSGGRIPGPVKMGMVWLIPKSA